MMREGAQIHPAHNTLSEIWDYAVSWYFFLVSWGVLYVALSYAAQVGHAERTAAAYRSEAQAAQLRALRYQINPHFLFNTLNSLSTLVLRQRTQEADDMICALSTFFRTSLTNDVAADVTLADEIALQRLYLDIEKIRFPERLSVVDHFPHKEKGPPLREAPILWLSTRLVVLEAHADAEHTADHIVQHVAAA